MDISSISYETSLSWMPKDIIDDGWSSWLGAIKQQATTLANVDSDLCHHNCMHIIQFTSPAHVIAPMTVK